MNDSTSTVGESSLAVALEMGGLGYKVVPIPVGQKFPKGLPKWQERATNDELQIQEWWGDGERGIGWAMGRQPNGKFLVAVDVDVNDGKVGKQTIEALIKEYDLAHAFSNTATQRTGTGGYHFIFDTNGVEFGNGTLGEHVDTRGEGGFIVIAPSIHPNGKPYRWAKAPWDVPPAPLPNELALLLADPPEESGRLPRSLTVVSSPVAFDNDNPTEWANRDMSTASLLDRYGWSYSHNVGGDQYWTRPGKPVRDGHSAVLHDDGTLVVFTTEVGPEFSICKPGAAGTLVATPFDVYCIYEHGGDVAAAMRYIRQNMMPREPGSGGKAGTPEPGSTVHDAERMGTSAPTNLPDEFWESRPWLAHIRQAAWNRQLSADAILGAVLTRYAAAIPPQYRIPAIIMAASTFDHISVLVAESGGGKSAAMSIARELFSGPLDRKDIVWDYPTPSGEGLVAGFFEMVEDDSGGKKERINRKTKTAVHFSVDEALGLVESSGRQGATIGSVLCTAWSGGNPGQGNASADRKRVGMDPWTYRMSGLASIQLSLGYRLLEDTFVQQGLSGRLVFFAAEDPAIPHWTARPEWPGAMELPVHPTIPCEIEYAEAICAQILEENHRKQTKQALVAPIDGHLNLVRLKLSGMFALMDGRRSVTESDWNLAEMVVDSHLALRNRMVSIKKQAVYERSVTAATAQATFEDIKDETRERRAIASLRETIIRHVPEEGIAQNRLRKQVCSSKTKHRFGAALESAMQDGKLVERDGLVHKA